MTKYKAVIIRNIVHVPVPIKMFISFRPTHMYCEGSVTIVNWFFLRFSTIITYMANMNIRVTSVIQKYKRRLNSKSKVRSTTLGRATLGARNRKNLWHYSLNRDQSPVSPKATLHSKPERDYCIGKGIVREFLLAELLIRNRNEWLN